MRRSSKQRVEEDSDSEASNNAELEAEMAALKSLRREKGLAVEDGGDGEAVMSGGSKDVYNKDAMLKCLTTMGELPFIETQALCDLKVEVKDEHDDLERELAFYNHSVQAVSAGLKALKALDVPVVRPVDYFCENVKSDAHMNKIKDRLLLEEKKIAALEARKARDMNKKYMKQMNKDAKKEKLASKNKRGVKDEAEGDKEEKVRSWTPGRGGKDGGKSKKRINMDKKYGFGGKDRRKAKLNDSKSLNDMSSFNPKAGKDGKIRSKAGKVKKAGQRPGKGRRDKMRSSSR